MTLLAKYVIYGEPAPKKNSKSISFRGGRPVLRNSKRYERWANSARAQLKIQKKTQFKGTITRRVRLKMTFFKAYNNSPDLSNLYEGPQDLLQELGIIKDDNQIKSHDGSRLYYMCPGCPERDTYKRDCKSGKKGDYKADCGKKKSCPFNRVEIEIHTFSERKRPEDIFVSKYEILKKVEDDIQKKLDPPDPDFTF